MNQRTRPMVLLLTATVDVRTAPFVAVRDERSRLAEYARSLSSYTRAAEFDAIVFCENSGYDLSPLRDVAARTSGNVEFLQFVQSVASTARGKGHGELEIVRHVLERSAVARPDAMFVKVTGRYLVRNVRRIVAMLRAGADYDVVADLRHGLSTADTRFCAFMGRFARDYLLPQHELVDDRRGYFLEHAFARAVHLAMADGLRWRPWPAEPDIVGVSGSSGTRYRRDPLRKVYRSSLRRIAWRALQR